MNFCIKHIYHIAAPQEKVLEALCTIEGLSNWWTVQVEGDTKIDGIVRFKFGEFQGPGMKVIDQTSSSLTWECVEHDDWMGHVLRFELDQNDGKTRVRFTHSGWEHQNDFYALCNFTWARYLQSLRQLCQTGVGQAFGSETYVK